MKKPLAYNATLVERVDLNPTLAIFKIRPDRPLVDPQWFVPGQYVAIGLNNEEEPDLGSVQRPMSIASAPYELDALEFYIRSISKPASKNPLTPLLWKMKAGGRIYLTRKPAGYFTLPHTVGAGDPRRKIFVSAGTGLAPFVSILRDHRHHHPESDLSEFAVFHGTSYPIDLGYREEMQRHRLRYFATVSRPKEAPEWKGDVGRVEDYFSPERIGTTEDRLGLPRQGLTVRSAVVYVCGLQGTIAMTVRQLLARGFVPNHKQLRHALEVPESMPSSLFFESYDTDPILDLKDEGLLASLREEARRGLAIVKP